MTVLISRLLIRFELFQVFVSSSLAVLGVPLRSNHAVLRNQDTAILVDGSPIP